MIVVAAVGLVSLVLGMVGARVLLRAKMTKLRRFVRASRDAVDQAAAQLEPLVAQLEDASWGLGGRIRKPTDTPIYLMPPGLEKTGCCDDARIAWMEHCQLASTILRTVHDDPSNADRIHPPTSQARGTGA